MLRETVPSRTAEGVREEARRQRVQVVAEPTVELRDEGEPKATQ